MIKAITTMILIAFSTTLFCQDEISYPNQDSTMFYWKNGYEDIVQVKFLTSIDSLPEEVWQSIVSKTLVKSSFTLKNKLSFVPRHVAMQPVGDKIKVYSKFLGKNSYGAESEILKVYYYTQKGDFLDWSNKEIMKFESAHF